VYESSQELGRVTEMAGVTFALGASSCFSVPRWGSAVFANPIGAHCSKVTNRNCMKKILHSRSTRRSSIVAAAEVPDFLPATWYSISPFHLKF
jgi:hypothetical protein